MRLPSELEILALEQEEELEQDRPRKSKPSSDKRTREQRYGRVPESQKLSTNPFMRRSTTREPARHEDERPRPAWMTNPELLPRRPPTRRAP